LILLASGAVAQAGEPEPWEGPALAADPQKILAALADQPAPDDAGLEILLEEGTLAIDGQRRINFTLRRVFRYLTAEGVRVKDARPFFAAGTVKSFFFFQGPPTRKMRLTVTAPAEIPLRHAARAIDLEPRRTVENGQVKLVFECDSIEPIKQIESFTPPDLPRLPHVSFSTGSCWADVAAGYAKIVEPRIEIEPVKGLVEGAVGKSDSRDQIIARLLDTMQRLVRYTAVNFGDSAIIPGASRQTLARRFGDCKDQSVLMAAMLRAAGIEAHLALPEIAKDYYRRIKLSKDGRADETFHLAQRRLKQLD